MLTTRFIRTETRGGGVTYRDSNSGLMWTKFKWSMDGLQYLCHLISYSPLLRVMNLACKNQTEPNAYIPPEDRHKPGPWPFIPPSSERWCISRPAVPCSLHSSKISTFLSIVFPCSTSCPPLDLKGLEVISEACSSCLSNHDNGHSPFARLGGIHLKDDPKAFQRPNGEIPRRWSYRIRPFQCDFHYFNIRTLNM